MAGVRLSGDGTEWWCGVSMCDIFRVIRANLENFEIVNLGGERTRRENMRMARERKKVTRAQEGSWDCYRMVEVNGGGL